jgi:hypothetical protein
LLANGNPNDLIQVFHKDVTYEGRSSCCTETARRLKYVSGNSAPLFQQSFSARGLAVGDLDNDGALDVLISCNDEAPILPHKKVDARNTYRAGDPTRTRAKVVGGNYLSAHDLRVELGIGRGQNGLDRDPMAEVQWTGTAIDESSDRSIHHDPREPNPATGFRWQTFPAKLVDNVGA